MTSKFKLLFSGLTASLVLIIVTYSTLPDNKLHIYYLDVGQGDSILVKTASNYKILVDGGPNNMVLGELGKKLPFWDKKIDLIVLSNPDSDHIKGLLGVIENYQVGQVWLSKVNKDTQAFKDVQDLVVKNKIPMYNPITGDQLHFSDGTKVKVLWPKERFPKFDQVNESSVVLLLTYGEFSNLLAGDAVAATQPYPELSSPVKVLKVPHHGARNGLSLSYLELIKPQLAVISAGKNNRYGHPSPMTLEKLGKVGSKVMSTIDQGTIEVVSTGKNWYTRTER